MADKNPATHPPEASESTAEAATEESALGDDVRRRLLDAAAEEFGERGYEGARVADIARRAGLTTGAIYNRFRGKDDLLIAAVGESVLLDEVFDNADDASPTDILSMLGHNLLDDDRDGVGARMFIEAAAASHRESDMGDMLHRLMEEERNRVSKVIEQAKADGLFDTSLDTDAVAKFCQAIGLGFCMFRGLGVDLPQADQWDHVISTVIAAALPAEARPTPPTDLSTPLNTTNPSADTSSTEPQKEEAP